MALNGGHVGRLVVDGHRHNRADFLCNCRLDARGAYVSGIELNIHEHRFYPHQRNGLRRGDLGIGDGDDLIPRPDLQRHECDLQGIGTGGDAQAMLNADKLRELLLQLLNLGPEDVLPMGENPIRALADSWLDRLEPGFQIDEQNTALGHRAVPSSCSSMSPSRR